MLTDTSKAIIARFSAYTLGILAFTALLPFLIRNGDIAMFDENGIVETMQFGLLICATAVFSVTSFRNSAFRSLLLILSCCSALAAFRELDLLLDKWIPVIGWKIGYLVIVLAAFVAYKEWHILKSQIRQFFFLRGFGVLWAALVIAIPFSQLVGHEEFLVAVMGDDYTRNYKRIIEESGELIGYFLLAAASLEIVSQMRAQTKARLGFQEEQE